MALTTMRPTARDGTDADADCDTERTMRKFDLKSKTAFNRA